MYRLSIVDTNKAVVMTRTFARIKDIIHFTKGAVTYNDTKQRKRTKQYRTKKDFFIIEKI